MKRYIVEVNDDGVYWRNESGKMHREEGPAVENADGSRIWYVNGKLHREDGPAFMTPDGYFDGSRQWYLNGKRHREDGPAIEYADGTCSWYLNGIKLTEEEFNNRNKKELTVAEIEVLLGYSIKIVA